MATLRIIDGAHVLDYYDATGTRRRQVIGRVGVLSQRDAERIRKQKELELTLGYQLLNKSCPSLEQFLADYCLWRKGEYPDSFERVEQIIRDYLLPQFGSLKLEAIEPRLVDAYKIERRGKAKSQTITKELRTLKAILNKAVEWKVIRENPIQHVKEPRNLDSKPPRFYTAAEMALIYQACHAQVNNGHGPQPDPLHASMWKLMANTGLRRGESMILRWAWIGRREMKILSTEEERTKSGKWREIPLSDGALEALERLPRGDLVFPRMTLPSLSRAFSNDAKRAGVVGSIHSLRHTYCSHLVMRGVPLRTVQILAGHSSIAVTEKYAHLSPDHLRDAGLKLDI